jgi:hypothetical protein
VKPDLIIFEPATPAINWVSKLASELVERTGARIVFVGSHVTSFPKETLQENPHISFVAVGEYEMTL